MYNYFGVTKISDHWACSAVLDGLAVLAWLVNQLI